MNCWGAPAAGKGWTQETDLGVQAAGVWVSCPTGNSKVVGCFLFNYHIIFDVVCRVQRYQGEVSMEAQLVVFILFIALAKVIFRTIAIVMVLGCWLLVPQHYRCEFLCSSLSCLHLIKVKFPDLNPVTFPSVVHTMGLWCQPLSMCLHKKRLTSGHYFDSFSHHSLPPSRCAWGKRDKELTRKCLWVETLKDILATDLWNWILNVC